MSQLTEFKRGYFHKLFALLIVSTIYLSLAYSTFVWSPSEGERGFVWYVLGVVAFMLLNIPLVVFIASYVVYAFSASHKTSYGRWMENQE